MPVFSYEAIIERGTRASGRVEAAHREDAARQLASKGLHVVRLREVNPTIWTKEIEIGRRRVKQEDFVSFCRQFATLVRAGIPLVESLQALTEQTRNKQLASALLDVTDRVVEGQVLSDSFAVHPRVFLNLFVQMIHAGEVSGTLDEVLDSVASYTEKQHETIEKVKSAMVYPISVSVSAIAVAIFLLVRVVPTFVNVFQNQHLVLPLPTRILLAISFFITHRLYLLLLSRCESSGELSSILGCSIWLIPFSQNGRKPGVRMILHWQTAIYRLQRKAQSGLTLIEVMVSVVILSLLATAVFLALQSVQSATLTTARDNQALGLATTISEEIKDGYVNPSTPFGIQVPGDALRSATQSAVSITVPMPPTTGTVATNQGAYAAIYSGFSYLITCSLSGTSDADYVVDVRGPAGSVATVQMLVHALS
ncbi:type II secretion system F family protein [Alicyclobacillus fastidiosus]|uniref:Type II secretion system F family protein n=1 Tax=Alicyclobacillus fastidiosus TaxID=392011 RepID=A0ABY6ZGT1_9BACL|nr:type II secretion system F family protein [Alicyclobacillus fastidiosus]WAH41707.1 type II secretion system F family protein [Alicyclobacillus fastidiosus]GMA63386.1 hypothetical protein GCM10025859_38260 [Alicyclobacillus fastidiosus]